MAALATAGMIVAIAADVIARWVGAGYVPGAVEVSKLLLVVMAFFAMPLAERTETHVRVDTFVRLLPRRALIVTRLVTTTVLIGVTAVIAYAATKRAWQSYSNHEYRIGQLEFPLWPSRAAIALGFCLLVFELARRLVAIVSAARRTDHRRSEAELGPSKAA